MLCVIFPDMLLGNLIFMLYTIMTTPSGTYVGTSADNRYTMTITFQQYRTFDIDVTELLHCHGETYTIDSRKIRLAANNNCTNDMSMIYDIIDDSLTVTYATNEFVIRPNKSVCL